MEIFALSSVLTSLVLALGVALPALAWFIDREQQRARRQLAEVSALHEVIIDQAGTINAYREMMAESLTLNNLST